MARQGPITLLKWQQTISSAPKWQLRQDFYHIFQSTDYLGEFQAGDFALIISLQRILLIHNSTDIRIGWLTDDCQLVTCKELDRIPLNISINRYDDMYKAMSVLANFYK